MIHTPLFYLSPSNFVAAGEYFLVGLRVYYPALKFSFSLDSKRGDYCVYLETEENPNQELINEILNFKK